MEKHTSLSDLPPFIAAAQHGFFALTNLSFQTNIVELDQRSLVYDCLRRIGVRASGFNWSDSGLAVEFHDNEDRAMFALAYQGP